MNIEELNISEETEQAIQGLRLDIELSEKKRVPSVKTLKRLVMLLKFAQKSSDAAVQKSLEVFVDTLTTDQLSFFKTLGVSLKEVSPEEVAEEDPSKKGKKRIIYRGRETWI